MKGKEKQPVTNKYIIKLFSTADVEIRDILPQIILTGGEGKNETVVLPKE